MDFRACHLRGLIFWGYPDGPVWANGSEDPKGFLFFWDNEGITMLQEDLVSQLSTVVSAWLLAAQGAVSWAGMVLHRLSLHWWAHSPRAVFLPRSKQTIRPPAASGCTILQSSTWKTGWVSENRLAMSSWAQSFLISIPKFLAHRGLGPFPQGDKRTK